MHAYLAVISFLSFLLIPFFIFKYIKNPYEWRQRLGFIKVPKHDKKTIWFHAASVGEINALIPLIEKFIETNKDSFFVIISTMTTTGHERARALAAKYPENIFPIMVPLDIPFAVKKALKKISPDVLVISETEIWPILIHYAHKYSAKILIINGRISHKTVKSYKRFRFIFKNTLKNIDAFGVQTDEDMQRFSDITSQPVEVTGNLKFALHLPEYDRNAIKKAWFLTLPFIIIFGSSRPGEELLVAELYHFLQKKKIDFQIILAPRHLHRINEIEKLLSLNKIDFQKLSEVTSTTPLLLIDTMGELTKAYAVSDVAFVGGSFYDFTGHNPLEPAYFSKPIIMGPYYSSCKDSVSALSSAGAIEIVEKEHLPDAVLELYKNPHKREQMGMKAKKVMEQNTDALEKNLQMIERFL